VSVLRATTRKDGGEAMSWFEDWPPWTHRALEWIVLALVAGVLVRLTIYLAALCR